MCYSDSTPSKTTICQWYADFKCGHINANDAAKRSGRLNEAETPENIEQVLKIVMDDQKLKVCEIAEMVNISTGKASTILHEKGLFQTGATFPHSETKVTTNRWFEELFGTVYSQ